MTVRLAPIARAVVLDGDQILLAQHIGYNNTFLPGGHIEPGEPAHTALNRELLEELGLTCQVGPYRGAIEHRWVDEDGTIQHEINHYFTVSLAGIASGTSPPAIEDHLRFFWSPLDDLELHNLRPIPLRSCIRELATGNGSIWWGSTL